MTKNEVIGSVFGDFKVLSINIEKSNWYATIYNVECLVCGSKLTKSGQTLYNTPKHSRVCYGGLYNEIPWKYNYSKRYANMLKRCKDSIYYKNIECELEYHEFMNEVLRLQKENNYSHEDMFNLTIDRINNEDNYKVGNIRMATMLTQIYNRRITPSCFLAIKGDEEIVSNSSKLVAEYLGVVQGAVNNCLSGRSKSCKEYKFKKISEEVYMNMKSVTTKAKIFHKEYE